MTTTTSQNRSIIR